MLLTVASILWSFALPAVVLFVAAVAAFATGPTNYLSVTLVLCLLAGVGCAACVLTKLALLSSEDDGEILLAHWSILSATVALVHYVESYRCDVFAAGAPVLLMAMCGPGSAAVVMASTMIASLNASPVVVGLKKHVPVNSLTLCCVLLACIAAGAQREAGDMFFYIRHTALFLPFVARWYRSRCPPHQVASPEDGLEWRERPASPAHVTLKRLSYVLLFALLGGAALFSWGRVVVYVCRHVVSHVGTWYGDRHSADWFAPQSAHILLDVLLCGAALVAVLSQHAIGKDEDLPDVITAVPVTHRKKIAALMMAAGPAATIALYWALREANAVFDLISSPTSSGDDDPFALMSPMSPMLRRRRSSSFDDRPAFMPFDSQRVDRKNSTFDVAPLTTIPLTPPEESLVIPARRRRSSDDEPIMTFSSPRTTTRLNNATEDRDQVQKLSRSSSVDSLMA
ncbi:membrane-associated protein, putative [Bodo saltans]|uniref:Membrane-associated protein, putative n=1 Tax=Bodo saltans TaxID=75058 RepID=A0A0S4JP15_BODSA|nr:membrane-associated protein, putative [Bodo saltans]|eukprot:CUG90846.1 membrane-associated protein, putative [Bodo saltans]